MFYPVNGDPFRSSVVLHLPMTGADNGTTFTDVSPSTWTITRYNSVTKTAISKWGQGSGYFDGNGDFLTLASSLIAGEEFTIEAWVYLNSVATGAGYVYAQYNTNTDFANRTLFGYNGDRKLYMQKGSTSSLSTALISLTTWTYLAYVRVGDTVSGYINGVKVNELSLTGNLSNVNSSISAGYNTGSWSQGFINGYLQDLRITKGVARYTADFAVPAGPLPARLPELPVRSIIQPHPFHQIARLGL